MSIALVSNSGWNTPSGSATGAGLNGYSTNVAYSNQTDTIIFLCDGEISYDYSAVLEYSSGVHHDNLKVYEDNVLVDTIGSNSPPAETGSRTWNIGATAKQLKFVMTTDAGLQVANASANYSNLKVVSEPTSDPPGSTPDNSDGSTTIEHILFLNTVVPR